MKNGISKYSSSSNDIHNMDIWCYCQKSTWVNNNLIPIQNILIGLVVACIEWAITKDFKVAIALSGVIAGGTYDVFHNLEKIIKGE